MESRDLVTVSKSYIPMGKMGLLKMGFRKNAKSQEILRVSVSKLSRLVSVSKATGLETEYCKEMVQ